MVNFHTKTLYFGYGDIAVGNTMISLNFTEFEPPVEVGTVITDDLINEVGLKYTSDSVNIHICSYEEAQLLEGALDRINGKDVVLFKFKDWVFNFVTYDPKSIEVIKKHLKVVRSNLLMCSAC